MALRALHLNAEEQPGSERRRRHGVLIEMGQQEIRRRILLGRSFRRDEREHDLVPRDIGGKAVAEEFFELVAMDARRARLPPDEQVCPHGRPIPRVAGILEQPLDDGWRARVRAGITSIDLGPLRPEEASELGQRLRIANDGWLKRCIDRAEGNPLFLEQLLRNADEGNDTDQCCNLSAS